MNKCRLSFIVPVFNGANYIQKCLDSLLSQDIPISDYEIILVNDCSTDNSKQVIANYKREYANIVYIEHSKNSRVGMTCNTGLSTAKGDYVWFVGQDDWINKNILGTLLPKCEENKLDACIFNYSSVDYSGNIIEALRVFEDSIIMKGLDFIHYYFGENFIYYLLGYQWRAIYKREFLYNNSITFPTESNFEDTTFLFKSLVYSDRVSSVKDFYYYYLINSNSIMYNFKQRYKGDLIYEFAFIVGNEVYNLSERLKDIDLSISQTLNRKSKDYYKSFARKVILAPLKEKIRFYSLLKENKKIVKDKITHSSFLAKIVSLSYIGLLFTVVVKPIYFLRIKLKR